MADTLVILPWNGLDQPVYWASYNKGQATDSGLSNLARLSSNQQQYASVSLFVPSGDLLILKKEIPTRNAGKVLKALPFLIEDQLATDLEQVHIAPGTPHKGKVITAVCDHGVMESWQKVLAPFNTNTKQLLPECLLLETPEIGEWSLLYHDGRILLRTPSVAFSSSPTDIPLYLRKMVAESSEVPQQVNLQCESTEHQEMLRELFAKQIPEAKLNTRTADKENPLKSYLPPAAPELDLLQGRYSWQQPSLSLAWPTALLLVAALLFAGVHIGGSFIKREQLQKTADELSSRQIQLYKTLFPDAVKVVKPKLQMAQHLKQSAQGEHKSHFLGLLHDIGQQVNQTPGVDILRLNYHDAVMNIELTSQSFTLLEQLHNRLNGTGRISATLSNTQSDGKKVTGRLSAEAVQ